MIANCDQIIDIDFDDYLEKHFEEKETDGSVLVFDKETENK
jgi:ADP-glucose pyrophosphorylase